MKPFDRDYKLSISPHLFPKREKVILIPTAAVTTIFEYNNYKLVNDTKSFVLVFNLYLRLI